MSRLCIRCGGTGTYLGNGMMMAECELCTRQPEINPPTLDKIDRRSESYKRAIKDIMAVNPDISRKDAVKMFDDAYVNG